MSPSISKYRNRILWNMFAFMWQIKNGDKFHLQTSFNYGYYRCYFKVAVHYVWCVICMCDARDLRIKGRVAIHQQTRVYIHYSQFVLFQPTNLVRISKKVRMRIFPLAMREITASRRDPAHYNVRIEANQPLYIMHSLLILDVFTHNSHTSRIVYSPGFMIEKVRKIYFN